MRLYQFLIVLSLFGILAILLMILQEIRLNHQPNASSSIQSIVEEKNFQTAAVEPAQAEIKIASEYENEDKKEDEDDFLQADPIKNIRTSLPHVEIINNTQLATAIHSLGETPSLLLAGYLLSNSRKERARYLNTLKRRYPKSDAYADAAIFANQPVNPAQHTSHAGVQLRVVEDAIDKQQIETVLPTLMGISQMSSGISSENLFSSVHQIYEAAGLPEESAQLLAFSFSVQQKMALVNTRILESIRFQEKENFSMNPMLIIPSIFNPTLSVYNRHLHALVLEKYATFLLGSGTLLGLIAGSNLLKDVWQVRGQKMNRRLQEEKRLSCLQYVQKIPRNLTKLSPEETTHYIERYRKLNELQAILSLPGVRSSVPRNCWGILTR